MAVAETSVGAALPDTPLAPGEILAIAELTPGGPSFGAGKFGASYGGSGAPLTYNASMDFTDLTTTADAISLDLGSSVASGAGFDTLTFGVNVDASGWTYYTFHTAQDAEAFFDGNLLFLGDWAAGTQTVDLSYQIVLSGDPPGFAVSFGVSLAPSAVPEPSTWAMLVTGFSGLGLFGWPRRRQATARCWSEQ
jgi:hypothetical protein